MEFNQAIEGLKILAEDLNVRDARKLYQMAKARDMGVTQEMARRALASDVARQVFRQPNRTEGKSAAEQPNDRFQADLVDFSTNAKSSSGNKFIVLVTDTFTRETEGKAVKTKQPGKVGPAVKQALNELADGRRDYVVSTDKGGEFASLDSNLPEEAVHRTKEPEDRNALAVVDRSTQTIKKHLATVIAKRRRAMGSTTRSSDRCVQCSASRYSNWGSRGH